MAHVTRAAWSAGLPTASGTFAFMSVTIRIMARAMFLVGLVSVLGPQSTVLSLQLRVER